MEYMVTIIVALITATATIVNTIISKKTSKKVDKFQEIKDSINNHILEADKTYLTDFLTEVENSIKKSDIQVKRAYEVYEEYTNLKGNSYIHDKWDELKKKGLL